MIEKLVNDWELKKKKLKDPQAIALVTVDGHSTRLNSEIWETLKNHGIIAMCKPAHTSNITSALDCAPNGRFKFHMQSVPGFPPKKEMAEKFPKFLEAVSLAAYKALDPSTIKSGLF
jgi:hypothetical protein